MASVIVAWRGACPERAKQDELLACVNRIAELSASYAQQEQRVPKFSEMLTARRQEGQRERELIETIDGKLSGRIVIRSDVLGDAEAFAENVRRCGLPLHVDERQPRHPVTCVEEVSLRGTDFRLFDPRRLYPGADRMSFVFMSCTKAPFLDGRLVTASPAADLAGEAWEVKRNADWYLECPFIHLRYVLEDWSFQLFSWVKYFFIPDLAWRGWEKLQGYEGEKAAFERMAAADGIDTAKRHSFYALMEGFRSDAGQWVDRFAAMRDEEEREW